MFIKQIKKVLNFKKDNDSTLFKVEKGIDFVSKKIMSAISESKTIAEKLKDLRATNYNLGLLHLEKGNLREAIFRFKIVRKFWPQDYDAHLKLIYCYFLTQEEDNATRAIEYLLYLEPAFKGKIENLRTDASFKSKIPDDLVVEEVVISPVPLPKVPVLKKRRVITSRDLVTRKIRRLPNNALGVKRNISDDKK